MKRLILSLFAVSNLAAITIENLQDLPKAPTEKIVYIAINTFFDIRMLKEEQTAIPVSYDRAYAQSLPEFMQKLIKNEATRNICKILLIDYAWQTKEENSFFAQSLQKPEVQVFKDAIHYFAPPEITDQLPKELRDKKHALHLDYLKEYIEKILKNGGVVILGAFYPHRDTRLPKIIEMYKSFQKKFKNQIALLTTAPDSFVIQAPRAVAQEVIAATALWWDSNGWNEADEQILYMRVDKHITIAEYFSNYIPTGKFLAPKKASQLASDKPVYQKILHDQTFAQKHIAGALARSLKANKDSKLSEQDLIEKKNLACTWVSLIPLPLVSDIAPLLEPEIDMSNSQKFTFKAQKFPEFNYANFTPYIEPFRAWKVSSDVLELPIVTQLKKLETDLTQLYLKAQLQ